jgi:hypothetical protein
MYNFFNILLEKNNLVSDIDIYELKVNIIMLIITNYIYIYIYIKQEVIYVKKIYTSSI